MTISAFLARFGFLCEKSEVLFTNVYSSSPVSQRCGVRPCVQRTIETSALLPCAVRKTEVRSIHKPNIGRDLHEEVTRKRGTALLVQGWNNAQTDGIKGSVTAGIARLNRRHGPELMKGKPTAEQGHPTNGMRPSTRWSWVRVCRLAAAAEAAKEGQRSVIWKMPLTEATPSSTAASTIPGTTVPPPRELGLGDDSVDMHTTDPSRAAISMATRAVRFWEGATPA